MVKKKKHDWEFVFFEWAIVLFIMGIIATLWFFMTSSLSYAFISTFWISGVICFILFMMAKGFKRVKKRS